VAPAWGNRRLRDILERRRHDGCGGLPARAKVLTGIDDACHPGRCCGPAEAAEARLGRHRKAGMNPPSRL
jgi:hypothetical protein